MDAPADYCFRCSTPCNSRLRLPEKFLAQKSCSFAGLGTIEVVDPYSVEHTAVVLRHYACIGFFFFMVDSVAYRILHVHIYSTFVFEHFRTDWDNVFSHSRHKYGTTWVDSGRAHTSKVHECLSCILYSNHQHLQQTLLAEHKCYH